MKIYTKTGDKGTTALFDGTRVSKDDPHVNACGDVDELNGMLGIAASGLNNKEFKELILTIQRDLFALGAQLANPAQKKQKEKAAFDADKISFLEKEIDKLEEKVGPLKSFVLPGGSVASSRFDFSRTICRRAERKVVALSKNKEVKSEIIIYLNRLSDLLFMLARAANKREGVKDIPWTS